MRMLACHHTQVPTLITLGSRLLVLGSVGLTAARGCWALRAACTPSLLPLFLLLAPLLLCSCSEGMLVLVLLVPALLLLLLPSSCVSPLAAAGAGTGAAPTPLVLAAASSEASAMAAGLMLLAAMLDTHARFIASIIRGGKEMAAEAAANLGSAGAAGEGSRHG